MQNRSRHLQPIAFSSNQWKTIACRVLRSCQVATAGLFGSGCRKLHLFPSTKQSPTVSTSFHDVKSNKFRVRSNIRKNHLTAFHHILRVSSFKTSCEKKEVKGQELEKLLAKLKTSAMKISRGFASIENRYNQFSLIVLTRRQSKRKQKTCNKTCKHKNGKHANELCMTPRLSVKLENRSLLNCSRKQQKLAGKIRKDPTRSEKQCSLADCKLVVFRLQ